MFKIFYHVSEPDEIPMKNRKNKLGSNYMYVCFSKKKPITTQKTQKTLEHYQRFPILGLGFLRLTPPRPH